MSEEVEEAKEGTSIFDLKLHEFTWVGNFMVLRVPGGWLYETANYDKNTDEVTVSTITFVPYSNGSGI